MERSAYSFNVPFIVQHVGQQMLSPLQQSYFWLENCRNVILETVKATEDANDSLILRLYESHGGRSTFKLCSSLPFSRGEVVDCLERRENDLSWQNQSCHLTIRPYQILSIKLYF